MTIVASKAAPVLVCAIALCSAVGVAAPAMLSAQDWMAQVAPLPATAESAYAQWLDVSGGLTPNAASQKVTDGIKAEVLSLARPVEPPKGPAGPLSARDRALAGKIEVFSDTGAVLQKIQVARTDQAALLQKWHAELNSLEQRRIRARSALPACHNDTGTPSQASIRDVEVAFSKEKIEIALRYLADFQPRVDKLVAAVSPRIAHGDATLSAWEKLDSPFKRAQLAPLAHGAESDALLDVTLLQSYIQEVSKLAARSISERNALQRVYANAKGC
jgi:hypothetical protein